MVPNGDKDQEGKDRGYFKANGLDHFSFNSKTVITWGVLSGIVGLFIASITVFQRFNSIVDQRIIDNPILAKRLDHNDWEIQGIKDQIEKQNKDITDIQDYFKPKARR